MVNSASSQERPGPRGDGVTLPPITVETSQAPKRKPKRAAARPAARAAATSSQPARVNAPAAPVIERGTGFGTRADSTGMGYAMPNATTGTKTDTPLMETPVSVQVIPQDVLRDQQVIGLDQALRNVSGITSGRGMEQEFLIRGFEFQNYYRNGLPFRVDYAHTQDLVNVDRIEVLKGPASVLYGRAEPGGIINFVTKQPQRTPYYSVRQRLGSYNLRRTELDATGSVGDGPFSYRVVAAHQRNGTWLDHYNEERNSIAPSLSLDISERTRTTLQIEYSDINYRGTGGPIYAMIPSINNRPPDIRRSTNLNDPWSMQNQKYLLMTLNTEHSFNDNWSIRHNLSYSRFVSTSSRLYTRPFAASNGDANRNFFSDNVYDDDSLKNLFSSLQLTGKFDTWNVSHTLLAGADYSSRYERTTWGDLYSPPAGISWSTNVFNPVYTAAPPIVTDADVFHVNTSTPWYGFYLQDQMQLPYDVFVLAGLRYDHASRSGITGTTNNLSPISSSSDSKVTPRFGVLWRPISQLSIYGSYTENFGASNGVDPSGQPLPPQTAQQFEAGIKTELAGGRLIGTLALFDLTKQNVAVPDPALRSRLIAVGEARSRGVEVDVSGEILPGWNIKAGYAYMPFAKITRDTNGWEGNRLHNTPVHSGSLWSTYTFAGGDLDGLKLGLGVQGMGLTEAARNYSGDYRPQRPGYAIVNAMASYRWKVDKSVMTAQLNIENLTDEAWWSGSNGYGQYYIGRPRTFMLSLGVEY
ncbi:ferrichrome-iron receptor [Nitrobacter winogradskyi]|nr:ferrichrome-iron receptor [Nitrobacter winogradskyi]